MIGSGASEAEAIMTLPVEKRDHKANRRVHIATRLFAVAFIGTLACFAAVILTPKGSTQDWAALFAFVFVLGVIAATANVFVAYGKLRWRHRCPECGALTVQVPEVEAGRHIRFLCKSCQIEWDTGWQTRSTHSADDVLR